MSEPSKNARDLFLAALDREPSERPELLERLCAGNKALRHQVEALLRVHDEPDSLLDSPRIDLGLAKGGPAPIPDLTIDQRLAEKPGTVIGPYKLLQKIGEGGFGVVYAAEQAEPVRRRVALKIIKPGMDTREVVARFEAERQALAMMDHPNIAKVLDAGTTESARPYFVMELVHGIPLTEYCDKTALNTRQRLSLLCDVCHAIQHAHQKGVIHRDIKPSNVLITLQDSKPIATVIDFGVSKAINQQLTEKTLFTAFGQMVGTPQYMSPEQAEMSGLDIDTRSDIYSLGVLMYELLTGTTPLDGQRLRALGYAEIQRIIREEEPLRPSNRISTLGDEATGVAKHRSVNAKQLRDQLSRELDWIVMKALDKDRNRRYETADALASDIDRYLRDQPVEACPPSAAYRLRKFATRNKASVGTAAAIALLLVAAIAVNMSLAVWAERSKQLTKERHSRELQLHTAAERSRKEEAKQRKQAEIQRDTAKAAQQQAAAQREVAQAAEERARTNFQQARLAVDQYLQTVRESELLLRPGMSPLRRQLLESARNFFQAFLDGQTTGEASENETATARYRLGQILEELGDRAKAQEEFQTVQPSYEQLVTQQADDHPLRLELVDICRRLGDLEMAQQQCEAVLEADATHRVAQRTLAALHEAAARQLVGQQQLDDALRRYAEAERIRAALTTGDEPNASDLADLAETRYARAQVLLRQQQPEDSLAKYRSGITAAERAQDLDPQVPRFGQLVATGMRHRARTEQTLQKTDEALRSYQLAESAWSRTVFWFPAFAEYKAELARTCRDRADCQRTLGRTAEADQTEYRLEQLLTQQPRALPKDHYQLAVIFAQLAQPTDDHTGGLSEAANAKLPRYAARAVEQLSLAVRNGYQPESPLDRDALLQPLASREDFQAVLAESRNKSPAAPGSPPSTLVADLPHHLLMVAAMRGVATAQRRLGQLDAAKTTLDQCMTELDQLSAGDPAPGKALGNSLMAQRGQTTYAMGHLHWRLRRYLEAKQAWDQGFALLKEAHDEAGKDEKHKLAHAIATEEGQLTIVFGEIAFWDEAAGHRDNYVKFGPYMSDLKECEIALITLVAKKGEHYEDACRYLLDRCDGGHQNFPYTLAHGKQKVLSPEKLVELASEQANSATPPHFSKSILGVCQLRNGNPQEAIGNLTFWLHFHRAQALFRIGEHDAAKFWLEIGERQYASSSRTWLGSETLKSPDVAFWNWWEQAVLQVSRAEAWQLIEQRPAADPWACLFEARGYGLVGDVAKSEAAFAEALVQAPETPEVWLASAETRAVLGQHDEAERLFAKALELAPEDPESWIARGKYYLERGLDALADADMMRAAELSNDDLDVFIRSGWWAVGPYPQDINESFPPEDSPHPSRPAARAGAGGGDNLAPRQWTRVPVDGSAHSDGSEKLGSRVRLGGPLTGYARNASVYALAYVYSPDARTATLCIGAGYQWAKSRPESQAQMRIRLIGETVFDWARCPWSHRFQQRLPVQLKAGRNEILVRVSSPVGHNFRFRLGDSPISQAFLAARLGRWRRAVEAFQRLPSTELVQGAGLSTWHCASLAAAGDAQEYEEALAKVSAYGTYTTTDLWLAIVEAATLSPNSAMNGDALLELFERLDESSKRYWSKFKGRALLRAGQFQQAIDWNNSQNLMVMLQAQCITAMAHHELGHEAEAKEWLQKAKDNVFSQVADRRLPDCHGHALLVEAYQRITGVPLAEDPKWVARQKEIERELAAMPPETLDYDLALMLEPKLPRLWVARARRYATLERWKDAERDFAEALRLDKDNAGTWLASARYWTGRENLEQARDAYAQVLRLDQDLAYREQVLNDLKDNEPLFLALLRTDQTQDWATALWQARGLQLCAQKRWSEAVRVWQRRLELEQPSPLLMYQLALLQTSSGDTSGYAGTCGAIVDRYAQDKIDSASRLAAWACILAPGACDDYTPVLELAQRCRDRDVVNASVRNTLGAVLLRAGRSAEAIAELEKAALWLAGHDNRNATPPAYAWYLLAMAHSQMGDQNAAQRWYDKAQTWTREQAELQPPAVMSWNRELTLSLLQNESAALLKRAIVPVSSEEGRDLCP